MINWRMAGLIIGALALGVLYAYPSASVSDFKFNSPDQNQYFFTASRWAKGQSLFYEEPLNEVAGGLVVPRSFRVLGDAGRVVPAGFWGLGVLDGTLAAVLGLGRLNWVYALWALLALSGFYFLQRRIWGARVAGWSAAILAICPVFWYLASQPLFPQMPLLAVLLWAGYGGWRAAESGSSRWYLLAGLGLGLALLLRLSALVWIAPLVALGWWWGRKRWNWRGAALAAVGVLLPVSVGLMLNQAVYGAWWSLGYNVAAVPAGAALAAGGAAGFLVESVGKIWGFLKLLYVPFGFHPRVMLDNFWEMMKLGWWFLIPAILIGVADVVRWKKLLLVQKRYLMALGLVGMLLVLIYGSWYVGDAVGGPRVNLGSSYWRYFLPVIVLLAPFWGQSLANWQRARRGKWVSWAIWVVFFILAAKLVIFEPYEGLLATRVANERGQMLAGEILKRTEANDIVVTGILDKYVWPARRVIGSMVGEESYAGVERLLLAGYRVYQASFKMDDAALEELNKKTAVAGLELRAEGDLSAEIGWYEWGMR